MAENASRGRRGGPNRVRRRPRPHSRAGQALTAGLLLCAACATAAAPPPADSAPAAVRPALRSLAAVIDSIADAPPLHRTHWGIAVRDLDTGATLYVRNADRHFIPASNTKLVVTLVALGELGPGFTWRTTVHAAGGTPAEPEWLVVRASGDPTLSDRFGAVSGRAVLDSLAAQVAAAGVRRITGALVIDATRFPDERVHSAWEVGDLPFAYAAPTGAFVIDDGTFRLARRPGPNSAAPARLEVVDGAELQPIVAHVRTDTLGAATRWEIDYRDRRDTVFISGALPAGRRPDTLRLAVADPDAYAARAFRAALRRAGVDVEHVRVARHRGALPADAHSAARVVAWRTSPPLADVVAAILKPSQNWIAEQLVRTLGAERGAGGSWADGIAVERRYLADAAGLDPQAFSLRDASGLTAQNLLTPAAILDMLEHARRAPWAETWRAALPTAGERGGTLSARLGGFEGRVQAKTGTIANVNSLSGYLQTQDGRDLAFSIMTNASGLPAAVVRNAMDAVVRAIDNAGRTP